MRKRLQNTNIFYLVLLIGFFILFLYFNVSLGEKSLSFPFKIISAYADSSLILLFCYILRGRWKYLIILLILILPFLLWVNLLYYRNFNDLLPSSLYLTSNLQDPNVISSIRPSIHLGDIIFFLIPFLFLIYWGWFLKFKTNSVSIKSSFFLFLFITSFVSWGISFVGGYRRVSLYNNTSDFKEVMAALYPTKNTTKKDYIYFQHNFAGYMITVIQGLRKEEIILNQTDVNNIREYLNKSGISPKIRNLYKGYNEDKNLIFIVVESLPYKAMELAKKGTIIPNLTKLFEDSLVIVNKSRVIAGTGRSSDAQFMYMTGLLPLKEEPLVEEYAEKTYPSLANTLKIQSLEIIGENSELWSHSKTNKSYGYDGLISDIAVNKPNQDSIIFNRAMDEIKLLKKPFYLFISTLSMHDPYLSPNVTHKLKEDGLQNYPDQRDREYLQRLHHFDESMGLFLESLKKLNLYDNTVIVIVGDHEIRKSTVSEKLHDDYVPFIIINSPFQEYSVRETTQLDIFPTILDIFNKHQIYLGVPYSGLGKSIFEDPEDTSSYIPSEEDYRISEMIIKGSFPE